MTQLRLSLMLLLVAPSSACKMPSSTEVGIRTSLMGVLEGRGAQEVYEPGGVYFVTPLVNSWNTLSIAQQNLLMNASTLEGDRPIPDDLTFKTKDGNNIYIDVNVMWRIDPKQAGKVIAEVGQTIEEIKERVVRPVARSVIRDIFNEITSEQYYHVTVKNRVAEEAKTALEKKLGEYGILVDMLQVQQHRFDPDYQAAINAQRQAEADVQTLIEQQKNMEAQKKNELEAKRIDWNKELEDALGEAGRVKNESDAYYQTQTNAAKAVIAGSQAEAEGVRKEAQALGKMGGDAYVKIQVSKLLSKKRIMLVPTTNVSTLDVNKMVNFLLSMPKSETKEPEP